MHSVRAFGHTLVHKAFVHTRSFIRVRSYAFVYTLVHAFIMRSFMRSFMRFRLEVGTAHRCWVDIQSSPAAMSGAAVITMIYDYGFISARTGGPCPPLNGWIDWTAILCEPVKANETLLC